MKFRDYCWLALFVIAIAVFACLASIGIPEGRKPFSISFLVLGILSILDSRSNEWDRSCLIVGIVFTIAGICEAIYAFNLF